MKKIGTILIILISSSIVALIAKDAVVKFSIERIVSIKTGLRMDIGYLKMDIPGSFISIKDVTILNPKGFDDKLMAILPEIYIDYDASGLLKRQIHLNDLRIDLRELKVVKNKHGVMNLDYLKNPMKKGNKPEAEKTRPGGSRLQIDNLGLKIGTVTYKDSFSGKEPYTSEYKINLDSRYRNIKNANKIIMTIVTKAILNTAISEFRNFDKLKNFSSGTLENGKETFKKTTDKIKDVLKSPFGENK